MLCWGSSVGGRVLEGAQGRERGYLSMVELQMPFARAERRKTKCSNLRKTVTKADRSKWGSEKRLGLRVEVPQQWEEDEDCPLMSLGRVTSPGEVAGVEKLRLERKLKERGVCALVHTHTQSFLPRDALTCHPPCTPSSHACSHICELLFILQCSPGS